MSIPEGNSHYSIFRTTSDHDLSILFDYNRFRICVTVSVVYSVEQPNWGVAFVATSKLDPEKLVYRFEEGDASRRDLLGGKGSGLCEMVQLGLPIPPGFVITTKASLDYFAGGQQFPTGLWKSIQENIR